ncbi:MULTISPECIES: STAS domain-containing protein [Marinomonas]|uniref:STAS domain-containing protein n=1 Tax=Marinomonas rhodophyticola TaxID=2992803 RepID=A0ABT3KGU1_9GAMM|nr:STAS domain-containing protein [Marinomonas sp. KJ51-3]MCW4629757.1 STAS domain-containing protein [Marinomonas sp. KJ51-3]
MPNAELVLKNGVLQLPKDMTIFNTKNIYNAFKLLPCDPAHVIILDLDPIEEMDGAGIQLLLAFSHHLALQGIAVEIQGGSPDTLRLLEHTNFSAALTHLVTS